MFLNLLPSVKSLETLDKNLGYSWISRKEFSRFLSRVSRETKNRQENARGFKISV